MSDGLPRAPNTQDPSVPLIPQVLLKIHSRCDLSCDYCYVFHGPDQRWRRRPVRMPDGVLLAAAERLAEHARRQGLPQLEVVLHGGEPLLAGPRWIQWCVQTLRAATAGVTELAVGVQTNGVRLDERTLDLFERLDVRVAVSLDGGRVANDRHRTFRSGSSSYPAVDRALRLLADRPHLFQGILCTVDVANDPLEVYTSLVARRPPALDFLLPHGHWRAPPPERTADAGRTPYADWLIAVFDHWWDERDGVRVRLFESLVRSLLGQPSLVEGIGRQPPGYVCIETDGHWELTDLLAVTFDGAAATGLHVTTSALADVLRSELLTAQVAWTTDPAEPCRSCDLLDHCGGGLLPHRFDGSGFANPSVYCPDLTRLIRHVARRTAHQLTRMPPGGLPREPPREIRARTFASPREGHVRRHHRATDPRPTPNGGSLGRAPETDNHGG